MNHRVKGIAGILLLVLVSCAIITVNVYFPEKEVKEAYKEMGSRLPAIDKLRDSGAAGEGKDGLLVVRDEKLMTPESRRLVDMENGNRRTVINGMARAIIRINRVPENESNLKQVLPQAVEQFAALRRDSAKKDWWIQDQYETGTNKHTIGSKE